MPPVPPGTIESDFAAQGFTLIGVDEVGRGCLAGPVFAAAVRMDYVRFAALPPEDRSLIRDSKTLNPKQRQRAVAMIHAFAEAHATGEASVEEIEELGILDASFLAMRRALAHVQAPRSMLLVDGHLKLRAYDGDQQPVVKGDSLCFAIAAASILAKEARDNMMREAAKLYPGYGFEDHVGYGTKKHLESIERQGICPLHRKTFAPIRKTVASALFG